MADMWLFPGVVPGGYKKVIEAPGVKVSSGVAAEISADVAADTKGLATTVDVTNKIANATAGLAAKMNYVVKTDATSAKPNDFIMNTNTAAQTLTLTDGTVVGDTIKIAGSFAANNTTLAGGNTSVLDEDDKVYTLVWDGSQYNLYK